MTDKTMALTRNLIAGYFALLGLAYVGCFVVITIESADNINLMDQLILFGAGLGFLMMVFGVLSYGLFKSRSWVVRLHMIILGIWLPFTSPVTIGMMPSMWRQRDAGIILFYLFMWIIPIAIQLFLSLKLKRRLKPGPALTVPQKVGVGIAVTFSGVVLFLVAWVVLFVGIVTWGGSESRELDRIENNRYEIIARHHPGIWVGDGPWVTVAIIDNESWLGGETGLWSSPDYDTPDSVSLNFVGSDSVAIVTYRKQYTGKGWERSRQGIPMDTIRVDLPNPDSSGESGSD